MDTLKVLKTRVVASSDNVITPTDQIAIDLRNLILNDPRGEDSNVTETTVNAIMRSLQNTAIYVKSDNGEQAITLESLASGIQALLKDEISKVSDGSHTFNELYDHRCVLFCILIKFLSESDNPDTYGVDAWFSKLHEDGTMFDGYIIAGITTELGSCTYHLKADPYGKLLSSSFMIKELPNAPKWDGHTSDDVLDRLIKTFF